MSAYRIAYVGLAGSGRTTSLARALEATGVRADPLSLDTRVPHTLELRSRGRFHWEWEGANLVQRRGAGPLVSVSAQIATVRSGLYSHRVDDPGVDSRLVPELDWLCRADGFIFVLDSQSARAEGNEHEYERLRRDLLTRGVVLDSKPLVFQANKRDLPNLVATEVLRRRFETPRSVLVESVAPAGKGTLEALLALVAQLQEGVVETEFKQHVPHWRERYLVSSIGPFADLLWDAGLVRADLDTLEPAVSIDSISGPRRVVVQRVRGELRYWLTTDRDPRGDGACELGTLETWQELGSLCEEFLSSGVAIGDLCTQRFNGDGSPK